MHISKELLLGDLLIADEVLIVSKKESFCTLITILAFFLSIGLYVVGVSDISVLELFRETS